MASMAWVDERLEYFATKKEIHALELKMDNYTLNTAFYEFQQKQSEKDDEAADFLFNNYHNKSAMQTILEELEAKLREELHSKIAFNTFNLELETKLGEISLTFQRVNSQIKGVEHTH